MKMRIVQLLLLLSLFVNITHDSLLVIADHHVTQSATEYILEQSQDSHCGHIDSLHYAFHVPAIIETNTLIFQSFLTIDKIVSPLYTYTFHLSSTPIKPPIV